MTRRPSLHAFALLAAIVIVAGCGKTVDLRATTTSGLGGDPSSAGITFNDHWHVALGVDDCGQWVPDWYWPPGPTSTGAPARAGSAGREYAGLHSHEDGLIHLEPANADETGANATLGRYFQYGGWQLSESAMKFVGVDVKNGDSCNGKRGVLRWSVNGLEEHGNPADYRLRDTDVVELVFTTSDATLPPPTAVPSYPNLRATLGLAP